MHEAEGARREELTIAIDGGAVYVEMRARPELAILCAMSARAAAAEQHLTHCRTVLAGGEDWGRRAGRVALAEALLAAINHDPAAAVLLDQALNIFSDRSLTWDEAEAHLLYARLLDKRGDPDGATRHRDVALEIYGRIGAGEPWLERARLRA
jgi:hypothetical protein